MHEDTRAVVAGLPPQRQGEPFLPGPTFAAPFQATGDPASSPYTYGRFHNPTWTGFESALAALEEAESAIAFASGMAAVTAVLGTILRPDDVVVLSDDCYYATRVVTQGFFREMGVQSRLVRTTEPPAPDALRRARLLWLETPANPGLDVSDVRLWSEAAREAGALVAVDNTTATPLGQRPLALGADLSVSSDSKALTGHGDLVLGHVACRDGALAERIRLWRTQFGAIPGPFEVWLAHRSLATLGVRLERQCANALAIATTLERHPAVRTVRYPGLASDPGHQLAARQMRLFGPVVSFTLPDRPSAERFLAACSIVREATSFGGVHTTAERRARWGGDAVPEGFIRLSAGCEHADDLCADVRQALDGAVAA